MIQTRPIGSHTEIYSDKNGGGKSETYITQSKTTVFHDFFTRKFLGEGETVEDFMEVTKSERDRLQGIRDAWVRPPQVFIDLWNEAAIARGSWNTKQEHGRYNEDTGYFELNGLTDITYGEAVMIYESWVGRKTFYNCRANLPINTQAGYLTSTFTNNTYLVALWGNKNSNATPEFTSAQNCGKIRDFRYFKITVHYGYAFQAWNSLEHIEGLVITAKGTMDLHWSPLLSIESVQNIIAANPEGNSIKPHPTVYAKLTGDTTNEEVAAMDPEELQKWMELVPLAAEKNITFVA